MGLFENKSGKNEWAQVIDWSPAWDIGAPLPQVFSNGYATYLIYHIKEHDSTWDGTYSSLQDDSDGIVYPLALIKFIHPFAHRFGTVNDEAGSGHPLYTKGLQLYAAHRIENSVWKNELKAIHRVHPNFNENTWATQHHFLLYFKDEMFEIIAQDYEIETYKTTLQQLATEVVRRMTP